jgi:hypothetical protein
MVGFLTIGCYGATHQSAGLIVDSGQAVTDESKIIPEETTKNEILNSFGPPTAIWEEENVFIYIWRESESGWYFYNYDFSNESHRIRTDLFDIFGTPVGPGQSKFKREWKSKMCFILFDQKDFVKDFEVQPAPPFLDEAGQVVGALLFPHSMNVVGAQLEEWFVNNINKQMQTSWPKLEEPTLIIRFVTTSEGIRNSNWHKRIGIQLGNFRTGGFLWAKKREPIEKNLKKDGWAIIKVEKGYQYIRIYYPVYGKPSMRSRIFQINVPFNDASFYVGSFHFHSYIEKDQFGRDQVKSQFVGITDESELAQQVVSKVYPQNSTFETSLAVVHEGPPILTTPSNFPPPPSE